jgi:hypothetical protein
MKRVVVLAEPESLFLPNLLARVGAEHPLSAVIEVPPPPLRVALRRSLRVFGPGGTAAIIAAEALARVVDRASRDRYYSLRKVARRLGVPYEKVSGLHSPDCLAAIARHRPDLVVAQVSRRIRPGLLETATFWNKHCSLLPAYAGVFPVFWAMLDGQEELGVTIHEMDEEFDRGPILQQAAVRDERYSFFGAYHLLHDEAAALLARALRGDVLAGAPQPDLASSYRGFPTAADRKAFRRAGRRFGAPFRLHAPVALGDNGQRIPLTAG